MVLAEKVFGVGNLKMNLSESKCYMKSSYIFDWVCNLTIVLFIVRLRHDRPFTVSMANVSAEILKQRLDTRDL